MSKDKYNNKETTPLSPYGFTFWKFNSPEALKVEERSINRPVDLIDWVAVILSAPIAIWGQDPKAHFWSVTGLKPSPSFVRYPVNFMFMILWFYLLIIMGKRILTVLKVAASFMEDVRATNLKCMQDALMMEKILKMNGGATYEPEFLTIIDPVPVLIYISIHRQKLINLGPYNINLEIDTIQRVETASKLNRRLAFRHRLKQLARTIKLKLVSKIGLKRFDLGVLGYLFIGLITIGELRSPISSFARPPVSQIETLVTRRQGLAQLNFVKIQAMDEVIILSPISENVEKLAPVQKTVKRRSRKDISKKAKVMRLSDLPPLPANEFDELLKEVTEKSASRIRIRNGN